MENKRRTILLNVLIVVLCISLCVGATFAFFTGSTISRGSKVKSGRLNVDLQLLTKGTEDDWVSIKKDKNPIFGKEILWEPGYTDVKLLRVRNDGTLAFQWEARISSDNEIPALIHVIDVYILTPQAQELSYPTQRDEIIGNNSVWTKAGTLAEFMDLGSETTPNPLKGILKENEDAYFGVAFRMQEDASLKLYQNQTFGEFDVTIFTVQASHETDSFGDDYDNNVEISCEHTQTVTTKGYAATCIKAGIEDYTRCATCGRTVGEKPIIPTSGHIPDEWIIDQEPTFTTEGSKHAVCTVCGETFSEVIPILIPSSDLGWTQVGDTYTVSIGYCKDEDIVIPDTWKGLPVTTVSGFGNSNIKSIKIPNSVTKIADSAFVGASKLESLEIPDSVTSIGYRAFRSCTALKNIEIPDSVTSIGSEAFLGCTALETIKLPDNITGIPSSTFYGCSSLTNIELPATVTYIGGAAFRGCYSLKNIIIPDSVTSIDGSAFHSCTNLASIKLSANLTSIGTFAFYNCRALQSVTIPASVKTIEVYAFKECVTLTSVTFENCNGWSVTADASGTISLTASDLANTTTAGTYIRAKYVGYEWSRS